MINYKYFVNKNDKINFYKTFKNIFKNSFNQIYNYETYYWKYLHKVSKNSFIQIIYYDNNIVGLRGLWKINEYSELFYQCIDTCILPKYRRMGIFYKSNSEIKKKFKNLYNYPNSKSLPGYLKSGWKINYNISIIVKFKINEKINTHCKIDFLNWRFVNHPYIKYYKYFDGKCYHIFRYKKSFPIYVFSTNESINLDIIYKPLFYFKYTSNKELFVIKNAGKIISYGNNNKFKINYFDMI